MYLFEEMFISKILRSTACMSGLHSHSVNEAWPLSAILLFHSCCVLIPLYPSCIVVV